MIFASKEKKKRFFLRGCFTPKSQDKHKQKNMSLIFFHVLQRIQSLKLVRVGSFVSSTREARVARRTTQIAQNEFHEEAE